MKKLLISFILIISVLHCSAQKSYLNGKFRVDFLSHIGIPFTLYEFSREKNNIKVKYFTQNAYEQYLKWKTGKKVLLVTAGALADSWNPNGNPIGLCIDNGTLINAVIQKSWDGLVTIDNSTARQGELSVYDVSQVPLIFKANDNSFQTSHELRTSLSDQMKLLGWGQNNGITLFQTVLLYSHDKEVNNNLDKPLYGNAAERRFLAICKKGNADYNVVIDIPDLLRLNRAAFFAKEILEQAGFDTLYILNLDRGDKDILLTFDGTGLKDMKPYSGSHPEFATMKKATSMLIYYIN